MQRVFGTLLILGVVGCSSGGSFTVKGSSSATASTSSMIFRSLSATTIGGSPTEFKVRVFKAYLSTNADCSDPVLVQDHGASGRVFDFYDNPTIFSASPAANTYNCLILVINDTMQFKADQTAVDTNVGCEDTTTEYTFDIYRAGEDDSNTWVDINGATIAATGSAASPGTDQVTIFITTGSEAAIRANGVVPSVNQVGTLSGSLTVPGSVTYYWDATDGVANHDESGENYCWIEEVETGFR